MAHNFVTGALAGVVVAGLGAGTVSVLMGPVVSPRPDVAAAVAPRAGAPAAAPDALPQPGPGDGASPQAPSPGIPEPESGAEAAGAVADTRPAARPETGAVASGLSPAPGSEGAGGLPARSDAPVQPVLPGAPPARPEADELSISNNPAQPPAPAVEEAAPQLGPVEPTVADAPMAPEAEAPVTAEGDPARTEAVVPQDRQLSPEAPAAAPEAAEGTATLVSEAAELPETPLASLPAPEAPQTAAAPDAPSGAQTPPSPVVVPEAPPVVAMVEQESAAPAPVAAPEPAVEPAPAPAPAPAPEPEPEPEPESEAVPEPAADPVTDTAPEPAPEPGLAPAPEVVTDPPRAPEAPAEPAPELADADPARPPVSSLIARDAAEDSRPSIGTPAATLTDRAAGVTTNRLPTLDAEPDPKAETAALRPIQAYATWAEVEADKPLMAIVLIDDGSTPMGLEALEAFPYPITFAVDTAWEGAAAAMRSYRDAGFEVMALADLPEGARPQDAEVSLGSALAAVPEAVAVLEGSSGGLQANRQISEQVADILADSGHGLVLYPQGLNTGQALAARAGVPAATLFRDFDGKGQSATVIRRFLDQAAFKAGQEGAVIMLGRLRPETISALLIWGLADRASRVAFVPVSHVLLPEGTDS